jgi:hypothetical protein
MPEEFFARGLRFECQPNCGACCNQKGEVYVSGSDISRLATFKQLPGSQFRKRFLRRVQGKYSLIDRPQDGCIFLSDDLKCTVYEARPNQCRTYPFWTNLLSNALAWEMEGLKCPGIGKGDLVLPSEIKALKNDSTTRA